MHSDFPDPLTASSSQRPGGDFSGAPPQNQSPLSKQYHSPKLPQAIRENIFAFPPNRDTLGGTAYLIVENEMNILIDSPAWNETNQKFLQASGGVKWLFLTHRGGIGKTQEIQEAFNCEVLIQEQEAYLLQKDLRVTGFQQEFTLTPGTAQTIWTPGHSPGSSCLYYTDNQLHVLFSGRHLLPNHLGEPAPLRTAKTFHWPRQLKSVQLLLNRFTPETLDCICPGANTGFLRGKRVIDQAYQRLSNLDLEILLQAKSL